MSILSKYVLRQFCGSLAVSLAAFVAIFVVIDLVERISAFIDRGIGLEVAVIFYACYLPYLIVLVLPMSVLLAGLFCMGSLIRNGELLAMKAGGISLYQVVLPLQVFVFLISCATVLLTDQVVPRANRKRADIEHPRRSVLGPQGVRSQVVVRDVGNRIFAMREFFIGDMRGVGVLLDRYAGKLVERIRAEEVVWESGQWTFLRGDRQVFTGSGQVWSTFERLQVPAVTLLPEDFARYHRPEEEMTLHELTAFIARKEKNGDQALQERVAKHMRLAFPFANFVIALFGLPMASRMRRSGRSLQVGVCLFVCFVFYSSIQVGRVMGWNGVIDPFWGAWGADLVFAVVGVVLLVKTRK